MFAQALKRETGLVASFNDVVENGAPLLGRLLLSGVFLASGLSKISAFEATQGYMTSVGVPPGLLPATIVFEVLAALALITGWQSRFAALLLAGFSVFTAIIFHSNFADQIQSIMFLKNMSIAGGLLLLSAYGPGRLSIGQSARK
ncbi:MAG: DoxX family protein [Pseudomonadota bacterium]